MAELLNAPSGSSPHIHQVRVAESVASELRGRILNGEFVNGELPKQESLRDQYAISHPSLREALRILETEGLVTVRRGNVGGATVHRPGEGRFGYSLGISLQSTGTRVDELAAALAQLEPLCARLCAENPDRHTEVVPTLRNVLARSADEHDGAEFTRSARDFHTAIVDLCGNRPLKLMIGGLVRLWASQEEAWAETLAAEGRYPGHDEQDKAAKAHSRLFTLIEAGKGDEAEVLSRRHLEATQKVVLGKLNGRTVDASSIRSRRHLLSR